jgi:hypothetical protein
MTVRLLIQWLYFFGSLCFVTGSLISLLLELRKK